MPTCSVPRLSDIMAKYSGKFESDTVKLYPCCKDMEEGLAEHEFWADDNPCNACMAIDSIRLGIKIHYCPFCGAMLERRKAPEENKE